MQSSKSSPAVPKLACLIACLSALRTWVETLQGGFVVIVIGKQTRVGVAGLSVGFLCLELEDLERQWFFGIHISVSSWRSLLLSPYLAVILRCLMDLMDPDVGLWLRLIKAERG